MGDLLSPEAEVARVGRAAAIVLERGRDDLHGPYHACNSGGPPKPGHPHMRQCPCGEFLHWYGDALGWCPGPRPRHAALPDDWFSEGEPDRWRWWHWLRYPVQGYYRWRSVHG